MAATTASPQIADEQRFRSQFGLRSDLAYVQSLHDRARALFELPLDSDSPYIQGFPGYDQSGLVYRMGALVTPAEAAALDAREATSAALADRVNGSRLLQDYIQRYPAEYGGMYVDQQTGGTVNISFTGNLAQHEADLAALLPPSGQLQVHQAAYTWAHLTDLAGQVGQRRDLLQAQGISVNMVGPDPVHNWVDVGIQPFTPSTAARVAGSFPNEPVHVHEQAPTEAMGEHEVDAPPAAGGQYATHPYDLSTAETLCSTAFVVSNYPATAYYVATAGHCIVATGDDWYNGDSCALCSSTTPVPDYKYGNVATFQFSSASQNDAALISIDSSAKSHQVFITQPTCGLLTCPPRVYRTVNDSELSTYVGEPACMAGTTSGGEHCTTIQQSDICITITDQNGQNGQYTCHQDVAGYQAMPGDSGGSWYNPLTSTTAEALGIESGGGGGISVYVEVQQALGRLGVYQVVIS